MAAGIMKINLRTLRIICDQLRWRPTRAKSVSVTIVQVNSGKGFGGSLLIMVSRHNAQLAHTAFLIEIAGTSPGDDEPNIRSAAD